MTGDPLAAATESAARFVGFLGPDDRLSMVIFDDHVHTIFGPAPAGDVAAGEAIARVFPGGSTNLSGGWLKGREHVAGGLVEGTNRVVLFTDGMANVGITGIPELVGLARGAAGARVTTSCFGFGPQFNEDLLREMSAAGGGNWWYIETLDRMGPVFDEEIEGLVSLAAQNLTVAIRLLHPRTQGVSFLQDYPVQRTPAGAFIASLGDLYATAPRSLGLIFHVEDVTDLGETLVAEVRLTADVVTAGGVEHRAITMPVVANLDGTERAEPTVERTFVRFEAARARREAVEHADRGDVAGAARVLDSAARKLSAWGDDEALGEEAADLETEARRMECEGWAAADRKYHRARESAAWMGRDAYIAKVARHQPRQRKPREPSA
jgi:Ca-activated chloride channel family protein